MTEKRSAYTLFEVLLVLVILVVVSGLGTFAVIRLRESARPQAAAEAIQAQLTRARNEAMEHRAAYRFAVKEGTGEYRIAPNYAWEDGVMDFEGIADGNTNQLQLDVRGILPEGVRFSLNNDGASGGTWRTVAVFLPDGSAEEDGGVTLIMQGAQTIWIRVHALTGRITKTTNIVTPS